MAEDLEFGEEMKMSFEEDGDDPDYVPIPEEEKKSMKKEFTKEVQKNKIEQLNVLLDKSTLYSHFLSEKLNVPTSLTDSFSGSTDGKSEEEREATFTPPDFITATLRPYQVEGVSWLVGLYENGLNGILADEMGLGKTLQTITFLGHLYHNEVNGPYLVVGPLSTIANWAKEFARWAPTLPAVLYHGKKPERERMRASNLLHPVGKWKEEKGTPYQTVSRSELISQDAFPVIITSYEIIMSDKKFLGNLRWKYIIVDEGHRLKNLECRLIKELKQYESANRLLLTGTPLQNNLSELWSLLNFLLPDIFDDLSTFQRWFDFTESLRRAGDEHLVLKEHEQSNIVSKLHQILRPFLLRRLKTDVEVSLPPRHELIVTLDMTPEQRQVYTCIHEGHLRPFLEENAKGYRLNGQKGYAGSEVMQLRKICNHPYLFRWPVDSKNEDIIDDRIVTCSGKMILLDRILSFLRNRDTKVLIFSQMTKMLDILEDFFCLRGYKYCRIDGGTDQAIREEQIEDFKEDPEQFVFLLSTRAGGLGINLTCANVVIFYDSDWNPQCDRQAQDRCHRIGQTKDVFVYRLATGGESVEGRILEKAYGKRKLEDVVIDKGKFSSLSRISPSQRQSNILSLKDLESVLHSTPGGEADFVENPTEKGLLKWFPEYDPSWTFPFSQEIQVAELPRFVPKPKAVVDKKSRRTKEGKYEEPDTSDEDILEEDEVGYRPKKRRKKTATSKKPKTPKSQKMNGFEADFVSDDIGDDVLMQLIAAEQEADFQGQHSQPANQEGSPKVEEEQMNGKEEEQLNGKEEVQEKTRKRKRTSPFSEKNSDSKKEIGDSDQEDSLVNGKQEEKEEKGKEEKKKEGEELEGEGEQKSKGKSQKTLFSYF